MGITQSAQSVYDKSPYFFRTKKGEYNLNSLEHREIRLLIDSLYTSWEITINGKYQGFKSLFDFKDYLFHMLDLDFSTDKYKIVYMGNKDTYNIYNKSNDDLLFTIITSSADYIRNSVHYEAHLLEEESNNYFRILFHLFMCDYYVIENKEDFSPVIKIKLSTYKWKEQYKMLIEEYEKLIVNYNEHILGYEIPEESIKTINDFKNNKNIDLQMKCF